MWPQNHVREGQVNVLALLCSEAMVMKAKHHDWILLFISRWPSGIDVLIKAFSLLEHRVKTVHLVMYNSCICLRFGLQRVIDRYVFRTRTLHNLTCQQHAVILFLISRKQVSNWLDFTDTLQAMLLLLSKSR